MRAAESHGLKRIGLTGIVGQGTHARVAQEPWDGVSTLLSLTGTERQEKSSRPGVERSERAKPDVIRDRVTHTKAARDAFSGYDRGPHWIEACGEVSKLRLTRRLATSFATAGQLLELSAE